MSRIDEEIASHIEFIMHKSKLLSADHITVKRNPHQRGPMIDRSDEESLFFALADADDADKILSLYRSVIGSEFCVWDEVYPGMEEIRADLETKNLFVLRSCAEIVGAISIVPENELDELECWRDRDGSIAEIARVTVAPGFQGRGLARIMVQEIEKILVDRGFTRVHLLVARENIPALKTYEKAGYPVMGECDMYGHRYFACEKVLE